MHPFTLLGEPVRLRIVECLAKHEQAVWQLVGTVGAEFSIGQSAISHHLRVLRDERFVEVASSGCSDGTVWPGMPSTGSMARWRRSS